MLTSFTTEPQGDERKPRVAPAPPTPVQLPLVPSPSALSPANHTVSEISQLFLKIHKTGPSIEHIKALNIGSVTEISLEQLLPEGHLPPRAWQADHDTADGSIIVPAPPPSTRTLSNGTPQPSHDIFSSRSKELLVDNEDAFRLIERKPALEGKPSVRLAYFRKFWDGLSQIADYWDTTLEEYTNNATNINQDTMEIDQPQPKAKAAKDENNILDENEKQEYTGRRIGTGKDMPSKHREDTVYSFVEAIAFAFRCRVEKPRMEPKVKLHNLFIPLLQTGTVYRYPKDAQQARRGVLEGPVMAIQCSNQTIFNRPGEFEGIGQSEVANLLREVGLMLSIAQKRFRDGDKEPSADEASWWISKPRWGGGAGGEIGLSEENTASKEVEYKLPFMHDSHSGGKSKPDSMDLNKPSVGSDRSSRKQDSTSTREDSEGSAKGRKRTKRSSAVANWRSLQPAPSTWEKNILYKPVGKPKTAPFDDVSSYQPALLWWKHAESSKPQIYLVSSLNHHISLVHLRVHSQYIEHLNATTPPSGVIPALQPSWILDVRRSRWFDFLNKEDRVQAMRGVWGAMSYLMRDLGEEGV